MKNRIIIGTIFLLSAIPLSAQSSKAPQDSPSAALDQFLTMGINGDLLAPEGWNKAGLLFVHPRPLPDGKLITVVGGDYVIHEILVRGNQAEMSVTYRDLGRMDSSLRYSLPDARSPKIVVRYHLMLIGTSAPSGANARETAGPREWRIESRRNPLWTGLSAAIQYVTDRSDKTTNPLVKRNAATTLMQLKKLQQ